MERWGSAWCSPYPIPRGPCQGQQIGNQSQMPRDGSGLGNCFTWFGRGNWDLETLFNWSQAPGLWSSGDKIRMSRFQFTLALHKADVAAKSFTSITNMEAFNLPHSRLLSGHLLPVNPPLMRNNLISIDRRQLIRFPIIRREWNPKRGKHEVANFCWNRNS